MHILIMLTILSWDAGSTHVHQYRKIRAERFQLSRNQNGKFILAMKAISVCFKQFESCLADMRKIWNVALLPNAERKRDSVSKRVYSQVSCCAP